MGKQVCLGLIINNDLDCTNEEPQPLPEGETQYIGFSKKSILQELISNKELLKDNDEDCSSGSESDPSEDNLDPEEIISVYPITLTPKPKVLDKKKINLNNQKVRAESNRSLTSQKERVKIVAKCKICAEPELPGHVCLKVKPKQPLRPIAKPQSSFNLVNQPYYNAAGKKVRDQATQTVQVVQAQGTKEEQKNVGLEPRTSSISPVKKEIRTQYRAGSTDESPLLGKVWRQEKAFHSFNRASRQSSAWKYNDSIRK